jgi:hypothetical protein
MTCKLRRDLPYQATPDEERFMFHDCAVHAVAFAKDGELLASAAADGKVKGDETRGLCAKGEGVVLVGTCLLFFELFGV